jgi:hypothetical protein
VAGASTAAGAAAGALAWLLTQVKTTRAKTPTATTIQVVEETDFTKFLIFSSIVSPLKIYVYILRGPINGTQRGPIKTLLKPHRSSQ